MKSKIALIIGVLAGQLFNPSIGWSVPLTYGTGETVSFKNRTPYLESCACWIQVETLPDATVQMTLISIGGAGLQKVSSRVDPDLISSSRSGAANKLDVYKLGDKLWVVTGTYDSGYRGGGGNHIQFYPGNLTLDQVRKKDSTYPYTKIVFATDFEL